MPRSEVPKGTDVIPGTLNLLILRTLRREPTHGFGITHWIEKTSGGVFKVNPGSLLTALQRLEDAGEITWKWRKTENARRARIYSLTRAGRKRLALEKAEWKRRVGGVARVLRMSG